MVIFNKDDCFSHVGRYSREHREGKKMIIGLWLWKSFIQQDIVLHAVGSLNIACIGKIQVSIFILIRGANYLDT